MVLVNSCHAIRKIRTTLNARIRSRIRIFRYICKTLFTINLSRHANGSPRQSQNQADKIPLSAARTHPRSAVVNRIHKLHDDRQRVGRHPLQEMVVGRQPVRRRARHVQRLGVVQPHHAKDLRIPDLRPAQNLRTVPRQRQGRLGIHDGSDDRLPARPRQGHGRIHQIPQDPRGDRRRLHPHLHLRGIPYVCQPVYVGLP